MPKTKWTKAIPAEPGYYWFRYKSKHGGYGLTIAFVFPMSGKPLVKVHDGGQFTEETRTWEKHHDSKFGPAIPLIPEAKDEVEAFVHFDKRKRT